MNCNSLLRKKGTFPYYYNYNGTIHIIYLTHTTENNSNYGVFIDPEANTSASNLSRTQPIANKLEKLYNKNKLPFCRFNSTFTILWQQ